MYQFANLQIGDNDLIGNKFNGHDLHLYLRDNNVESNHIVVKKQSNDKDTYVNSIKEPKLYTESILKNVLLLNSDIVHLHLIHNTPFDLAYLPIMSQIKPVVWTVHDPWALGGHCVHHFDCMKWQTHCADCRYKDEPFMIAYDDTAFAFALKKQAVQASQIAIIVASKWMEDMVKKSPVFIGKKIYRLPFGIDQNLFTYKNNRENKLKLGIDEDAFVIMFRADAVYKGLDIIKESLKRLQTEKKIVLIIVGQSGLCCELKDMFKIFEFGWINDDNKIAQLYQTSDIFLMPSLQESFGMMAIEAMSCGKLVLATKGTALEDTVNSPECGIAVENDMNVYAGELQRLIDNPEEIKQRGERSIDFARKNYNKDIYVKRIIEIYKDVIANHKMTEESTLILNQLQKYCSEDPIFNNIDELTQIKNSYSYRICLAITKFLSFPYRQIALFRDLSVVSKTKLFDREWYLQHYPDVARAKIDPLKHYLKCGWQEGRNPGPNFDGNRYLQRRPDVKAAGMCPLVHYEKFGKKEKLYKDE